MAQTPTWTIADSALSFTVTQSENGLTAHLRDLRTGREWGPSPLLIPEVHDRSGQRTDRLETYRIDRVESGADFIHPIIGHTASGIALGIWFRLVKGELRVVLSLPEVYERIPTRYRLFAVDILPGFMDANSTGRVLTPIAGGTSFCPANKPAVRDRFLLYLEQSRWELGTVLPLCAAHDTRGGLCAIATGCAQDMECRVETDGKGTGRIGYAITLRRFWPDPVDFENRQIVYSPIRSDEDPVIATAKRLRRHAMEDWKKQPLAERRKVAPEVEYLFHAPTIRPFFGIENEGMFMQSIAKSDPVSFTCTLTFGEARQWLDKYRAAGLRQLHTEFVGWNARGHDGMYPTRFPIDERFGGETGFRELVDWGSAHGWRMNVHDNYGMTIQNTPNYDAECVIHDISGVPLLSGWWSGGDEYFSWPNAFPHARLEGHMEHLKALGIRGKTYCDYMMRPLEVNYHPRWKGPRGDHMRGQMRVMKAAQDIFGAVGTEYGIFPAAMACDSISGFGGRMGRKDWPIGQLCDRKEQTYLLAIHGLVLLETGYHPSWDYVLNAVSHGLHLRDEWAARPVPSIAVITDQGVHAMKAAVDICLGQFGHLLQEEMVSYAEPADKVRVTKFADGTEVSADFNTKELVVNGKRVERPAALA